MRDAAKVVIWGAIRPEGIAVLEARPDTEVTVIDAADAEGLAHALTDADGLLIRTAPLTPAMIAGAKNLKVVARHGVGYDNVPVDLLTARGIPLALTGAVNTLSVAEHTFFMMLSAAKAGIWHDRAVRSGNWNARDELRAVELAGRTLLLVGFGRIGREVAVRAAAFGMTVRVYDPHVSAADMTAAGVDPVPDWRAALSEADVVSLHLPLTPDTRHLIGQAELAAMKTGSVLINAARGGLVDENALADALRSGHLAGAGIDTLEAEPPAPDHPLLAIETAILSPHNAGLTLESAIRLGVTSAQNIVAGLAGCLDPALVANPQALKTGDAKVTGAGS
ncbi:hydroxyacid dehydrogenase [Fodinicurvata sp. EGI_FJ10296]|uniref:hydroxyacid dehydrogenase n=1 Tax=Fodinicurvata sp. EGI_FJ10296 TaxID=3231908 RepID=UPI003454134B